MTDGRLWHGGWAGLKPGELLLPPTATGNGRQRDRNADLLAAHPGIDPALITHDDPLSDDWVYFTPHRNVALAYAGTARQDFGSAALYVVEPVGAVETDPDFPIQGLRARSATVVKVYDPHVTISRDRAASLHMAALAVERGTTRRQQRTALDRHLSRAFASGRPPQIISISAAQDRGEST